MLAARRFPLMMILLAAALPAKVGQRSEPPRSDATQHTVRVDVNLVTIGVRVSDRKSREVSGLKQEEFSVFEDGKQQPIALFASEQQPVSVLILLDRSYSMGQSGKLDQAKSALRQLLENGHSESEYALMVFHDESIPLVDFVADRQKIETALGKVSSHRSGSSLYDSVVVALDRFDRARYPRHVLVAITDGADQHSRLRLNDVLRAVQGSQSQVYLIGFFDPKEDAVFRDSGKTVTLVSGKEIDNPRYVFKRLADESGAERYFPAQARSCLPRQLDPIAG
jgi:VWFA-related protein